MTVTIYHNPNCGTSRNALAMSRQRGEEPVIIEYLKTPPSRARLQELIATRGIPVRAPLREKGTPYAELGLADPKWTDDDLVWLEKARAVVPALPFVRGHLAAAYALSGEIERAAVELAEAQRLSSDDRYVSLASSKALGEEVSAVRAMCEATYFAGLCKAGMPEE
jgi:arsenate reductase (glutaredoxin)